MSDISRIELASAKLSHRKEMIDHLNDNVQVPVRSVPSPSDGSYTAHFAEMLTQRVIQGLI
jgi:hypothetical protein